MAVGRSVMRHAFNLIPHTSIPRSMFNRTHGYKTTFDSGYLVPVFVDEVLPGDTFHMTHHIFGRLATPIFPIMDNLFLDTFYFFVPNRLIHDNWQRLNGEQDNPGDTTDYLIPQITAPSGGWQVGSLSDYLGLPTQVDNLSVCSFWHRAYNFIYNEWFRDQNLQDSVPVPKGDGPDNDSDFVLLRRGKRHDYFTSCLPWPQKGPGVELPLGGTAPVSISPIPGSVSAIIPNPAHPYPSYQRQGDARPMYTAPGTDGAGFASSTYYHHGPSAIGGAAPTRVDWWNAGLTLDPATITGVADLSAATAATINSLRQAFQVQKLLERDARGGTRYTEILRAHFGVVSPDARLQRPEYLGGSTTPIVITPVAQTAATDTTSPQGNLAAFGTMRSHRTGFHKSFVEHGVILGLANVRADLTYQQGIDRKFSRRTRFDVYWPALAHIGEQAVLNKEIYAQGTTQDNDVFGYQERWAEYRYFPSKITGKFRSTYAQTLDAWHLSQRFDNLPTLSAEWIVDHPPIPRVIAVPSEPEIIFDSVVELRCARPMPVYSVPGLVDHF